MTLILKTQIGSHAWDMATPESDVDYFVCYAEPTRAVLDGTARWKSRHIIQDGIDQHIHEVGHVVKYLVVSPNWNFYEHVLSPVVDCLDGPQHNDTVRAGGSTTMAGGLVRLTRSNLNKGVYEGLRGMSWHNYVRYAEKGKDVTPHHAQKILRNICAGIRLFETGRFEMRPISEGTWDDVPSLIESLDEAHAASNLPERPDETPFRDWLFGIRMSLLDY